MALIIAAGASAPVPLLLGVLTLTLLGNAGTLQYTFPMRVDAAPFDNCDLRMAVKSAVNPPCHKTLPGKRFDLL